MGRDDKQVTGNDIDWSNTITDSPEIQHDKPKKTDGLFSKLKKKIHKGIENQEERRANAPKLSKRGVIGVQLAGGGIGFGGLGGAGC